MATYGFYSARVAAQRIDCGRIVYERADGNGKVEVTRASESPDRLPGIPDEFSVGQLVKNVEALHDQLTDRTKPCPGCGRHHHVFRFQDAITRP